MKLKFSILILGVFLFIGFFFWYGTVHKWHIEHYVLEGASYSLNYENVITEKVFYIAGDQIRIMALPQVGYYKPLTYYEKSTGPYKISLSLEGDIFGSGKKAIIHNAVAQFGDNKDYLDSNFPILIQPKATHTRITSKGYQSEELIPNQTEVSYHYLFPVQIEPNFSKREIVEIMLDIEVAENGISVREQETFKMVPILDRGWKQRYPGDGV